MTNERERRQKEIANESGGDGKSVFRKYWHDSSNGTSMDFTINRVQYVVRSRFVLLRLHRHECQGYGNVSTHHFYCFIFVIILCSAFFCCCSVFNIRNNSAWVVGTMVIYLPSKCTMELGACVRFVHVYMGWRVRKVKLNVDGWMVNVLNDIYMYNKTQGTHFYDDKSFLSLLQLSYGRTIWAQTHRNNTYLLVLRMCVCVCMGERECTIENTGVRPPHIICASVIFFCVDELTLKLIRLKW